MPRTYDETAVVGGKWAGNADEEQAERPRKAKVGKTIAAPKTSYESSSDVQRWLQEQSLTQRTRPPFDPSFLAGRRDREWILSSLNHFYENELIDDLLFEVKSGKEATVYCCRAGQQLDTEFVAAKIYRPRMFRSLSNDAVYREGRTPRNERGRIARGTRRTGPSRSSEKGRAFQVSAWIDHEYGTLEYLYDGGIAVPQPIAHVGNSILMEFVGDGTGAAPLLREVRLPAAEAGPLFTNLLENIELSLKHHRIHGDLSAYNVLYWQGRALIIDVAQAVDPRLSADAFELLARDVERICDYFRRYGLGANGSALAQEMWERYMMGGE
ncbi:MAG: hypothetical protein MUD01_14925 [Chloroflexaceae bacterium]|jgi:RIO kinase 1|nr:hypothetical protein [Chloroflexaceae bacterium]